MNAPGALSKDYDLTRIKATTLNHRVVKVQKLGGWQALVWIGFGDRSYKRNRHDGAFLMVECMFLGLDALCIFIYHYFSGLLFGFVFLAPSLVVSILWPLIIANQSRTVMWAPISLGLVGFFTHWQFGFSVFGYPMEPYLFIALGGGGVIALYRRAWNGFIWKVLDKIVLHYHLQFGLDLAQWSRPIKDFQKAFDTVSDVFCQLMKTHWAFSLTDEAEKIRGYLQSHTKEGLDKAVTLMQGEIERARAIYKKRQRHD